MSFGIPVRNGVSIGAASAASMRGVAGKAQFYLNFTGGALPSGVSASGGANGTRVNISGLLAATSAPRFDYSPTSVGTSLGVLAEAASTNIVLYSEQLNNAAWTAGNATVTADAAVFVDGATTADLLKENTALGSHSISQNVTVGTGNKTVSVYAKLASGTRYLQLREFGVGAGKAYANYNLSTGAVVNSAGTELLSATITNAGNGWYRCTLSFNAAVSNTGVALYLSNGTTENPNYTGDGTSGIYLGGVQVEAAATASTYVQTVAAAVTRSADAISFTIPANFSILRYTFDNDTTQDVAVSAGAYTIPTTLNRVRVKTILGI